MNTTAVAVTLIVFFALVLAMMAGIAGYTLGRARATDAAKKASEADSRLNETLLYCKGRTEIIAGLLSFETEQSERYRDIARRAVEALPSKDLRKLLLECELQKADNVLQAKIAEVKEVTKKG